MLGGNIEIINQLVKDSIDVWDKCISSKFLIQMQEGTFKKEVFLQYLIQDSLYLRDYLKAYSYGFIKCKSWEQWTDFANRILQNVPNKELLKSKDVFYQASIHELRFWEMLT